MCTPQACADGSRCAARLQPVQQPFRTEWEVQRGVPVVRQSFTACAAVLAPAALQARGLNRLCARAVSR